jgi:hypothetical protein
MANRWATDIIRRLATQTPVAYDFDTDTLKLALMATAYNPATAFTTTNTYADISASEASGTGYTATGITVPTPAWTTTQANSYGRAWTATTAYNVGDVIRPSANTNGHLYMVVTAVNRRHVHARHESWLGLPHAELSGGIRNVRLGRCRPTHGQHPRC